MTQDKISIGTIPHVPNNAGWWRCDTLHKTDSTEVVNIIDILEALCRRMRIYEYELAEKYSNTSNIVSFTEYETTRKNFVWINEQIKQLRGEQG